MEDIYLLLLGAKYKNLDKCPAGVIKVTDLAVKAYDAAKMQEVETFVFVMNEMKKFINFGFASPQKEKMLKAVADIEKSNSPQSFLENFRTFLKITLSK
jgi:hypothetical protein